MKRCTWAKLGVALLFLTVGAIWLYFHSSGSGGDAAAEALFSGLAFAGVLVALRLQSHELALQREELTQTRQELKGQKEQLEAQDRTMRLQAAESTFFQVLQTFRQVATGISDPALGGAEGPHYWRAIINALRASHLMVSAANDINAQVDAYEKTYLAYSNSLAPYFANLNELLTMLATSAVLTAPNYARLVRAQLSPIELLFIGFHGLTIHGRQTLKPLIEKFGLLKHIPQTPDYMGHRIPTGYNASALSDPTGSFGAMR